MKKFLLVAVCFAMALSSCIKDETSASVDRIYDAYAQKLSAEAALTQAEADALAVLTEAEAALMAAQTESVKIWNQILDIQRQLAEVELEYAKAELEVKLAELEAKLVALQATMEKAAVEAEAALLAAQTALNKAQEEFIESVKNLEAAEAARLVGLFNAYTKAVEELIEAKTAVTKKTAELAAVENQLVDAEEYRDEVLAQIDEKIAYCQRYIAIYESAIETVKKYQGATVAEIDAALDELQLEAFELETAAEAVSADANALAEALEFVCPEVHPFYEYLSENPLGLVEVGIVDGEPWYGYAVLNDDPLTQSKEYDFVPLYTCYYAEILNEMTWENEVYTYPVYSEETVLVEKEYEGIVFAYEYEEAVSLGEYNAENIAKYAEYVKDELAKGASYLENMEKQIAEYEAQVPYFKGAAEKAMAWAEAEAAYEALVADTTEPMNYSTGDKTTYGIYCDAKVNYEGGEIIKNMMVVYVEGAKNVEAAAAEAKAAADAAAAAAKAAYEAAKKAAEATGATNVQKEAAKAAEEAYNEAKRAADWANEEYEIAKAQATVAKAALDAAEKALNTAKALIKPAAEAVEVAKHAYDIYYMQYCTALGFPQYGYNDDETTCTGAATFDFVSGQYENFVVGTVEFNKAYYDNAKAEYEAKVEVADLEFAEIIATLDELSADEAEYLAAYNEAYKAAVEAALDQEIAWFQYDFAEEMYYALLETRGDAVLVEEEIASYEEVVECCNKDIKALEADKVKAADLATYEDAVEFAKMRLEAAEAAVEFYTARAEAAEAAWKDAE